MTSNKHFVRIIGGRCRGRKVFFYEKENLRPTPDRVRETVFNWLASEIREARCLDAFAGTGVLGFEAVSRGASFVYCIEKDPHTCKTLKANQAALQLGNIEVVQADALAWLQAQKMQFDVIFLDPPYQSTLLSQALSVILDSPLCYEKTVIYIEANQPYKEALPFPWEISKVKKAGQVYYHLLRQNSL